MITYLNLFFTGLRWGAIEQFTAQLALLAHQFFLYRVCGPTSYGSISVMFSLVWLTGALMNFGFDQTLSPLFADALSNRSHFRKTILQPLIVQTVILGLGSLLLFTLAPQPVALVVVPLLWLLLAAATSPTGFRTHLNIILLQSAALLFLSILMFKVLPGSMQLEVTLPLRLLLAACAFAEGLRRSLRIILQFSGRYKMVAGIEIMYTALYLLLVWSMYAISIPFAPTMLLASLLFVNALSIILLAGFFRELYYSLPDTPSSAPLPYHLILQTRCFGYVNQLINQLFSTSFLVPLTASLLDQESSAVAALVGYLSYFLGSLFKRTFGIASGASFARARREVAATKQHLFAQATSLLYGSLIVLIIALPFMLSLFLSCIDCPTTLHYTPLYLLFFITLSEHLLMTYERFFLTEDHVHIFTLYNVLGFLAVGTTTLLWNTLPLMVTAFLIITTRLLSIFAIARSGFKKWGISLRKPNESTILTPE